MVRLSSPIENIKDHDRVVVGSGYTLVALLDRDTAALDSLAYLQYKPNQLPELQAAAQKAVAEVAKILKVDPDAILSTLRRVHDDPHTQFLVRVWR